MELTKAPAILYTYQIDDINNPTAIKNSYTKTVTIEGTDKNDRIFGSFWRLDRAQGSRGVGASFNSTKKVDFQLFVDADIMETGYVQLNEVKNNGERNEYSITLYGGLGDFFYNLDVDDNTGGKRKLSSLTFTDDIDFTINRETVNNAWESLRNDRKDKYQTINFLPSYNGIPKDFDSTHVLVNTVGTTFEKSHIEDGVQYTQKGGYVLGNLADNYDEHQMRDYRSYLMRPTIRMKSVIEAVCNPENNGGYQVNLDEKFFNDKNPYYNDTWLTLPTLSNLELVEGEEITIPSQLIPDMAVDEGDGYMYQSLILSTGSFPKLDSIQISTQICTDTPAYYSCAYTKNWLGKKTYYLGSLFVQLVAYNGNTVVGYSDVANLTNELIVGSSRYTGTNDQYSKKFVPVGNAQISTWVGEFHTNGFKWKYNMSYPNTFYFTINNLVTQPTTLRLRYYWGANDNKLKLGRNWLFTKEYDGSGYAATKVNPEQLKPVIVAKSFKAEIEDTLARSNVTITKDMLLNTENSPCDYLLSYCKHFGLYFTKEVDEDIINIQTRESFYDRESLVDITDKIDKGSQITITPTVFNERWIQMKPDMEESDFSNKYILANGVQYGEKLINTGYEFNSERKNIFENNCIKDAVEGHQRSSLYSYFNSTDGSRSIDKSVRTWMYGMTYNLYHGEDTIERTPDVIGGQIMGINPEYKFYDFTPKVQFHHDNNPIDGNDVLVFFSGFKEIPENIYYWLTDDSPYQGVLNNGEPCWLFTTQEKDSAGNDIAIRMRYMPVFERYMTTEGSPYIQESLDMGVTRELYCQGYRYKDGTTIYEQYWSDYLEDLYDVDTKILKCKMLIPQGYNSYNINTMLRQFYWYENTIWRINKITDYDVTSNALTNVEFIKVKNPQKYTSTEKTDGIETIGIKLERYSIDQNGGTIIGYVTCTGPWRLVYDDGMTITPVTGDGNTQITLHIDPSNVNKVYNIELVQTRSILGATATVTQGHNATLDRFDVSPNTVSFNSEGGRSVVNVTDDGNHGFTVKNENTWFNYEISGNTIIVICDENEAEQQRQGVFYVIDSITKIEYEVTVVQEAKVIEKYINAPEEFIVNSLGGTYFYEVEASHDWEIVNPFQSIGVYSRNGDMVIINSSPNTTEEERVNNVEVRLIAYPEFKDTTVVKQEVYKQKPDEPTEKPDFTIPSISDFPSSGGEQNICITSDYDVSFSESCDWIEITKEDNCFKIKASENNSTSERTCNICFEATNEAGTTKKCVDVKQSKKDTPAPEKPDFDIPTLPNFDYVGGEKRITIISEEDITAEESCDWITINKYGNVFDIIASENTSYTTRSCEICFSATNEAGTTRKCGTVNQVGSPRPSKPSFTIPSISTFPSDGGSQEVCIDSDYDISFSESCDWVNITKRNNCFTITASENNSSVYRTCNICFSATNEAGTTEKCVDVWQEESSSPSEPDFDVPTLPDMPCEGGDLRIDHAPDIQVSWACPWVTNTDDIGDNYFVVHFSENCGGLERTCSFRFRKRGVSGEKYVDVKQEGLIGESSEIVVPIIDNILPEGIAKKSIHVQADFDVKVRVPSDCLWVEVYADSGKNWFYMDVNENRTGRDRSCTLRFSDETGLKFKDVKFTQYGNLIYDHNTPYIPNAIWVSTFEYSGGERNLNFETAYDLYESGSYEQHTGADLDWVSIKQNGNSFTITVEENPTDSARAGDVVICATNEAGTSSVVYTVYQLGKNDVMEKSKTIYFPYEGDEELVYIGNDYDEHKVISYGDGGGVAVYDTNQDGYYNVCVGENKRGIQSIASVRFRNTDTNESFVLYIIQDWKTKGKPFFIVPEIITASSSGMSQVYGQVTFENNYPLTVVSSPCDWLTVTTNGWRLNLNVEKNTVKEDRYCEICLESTNSVGTTRKCFTVRQFECYFC